MKKINYILFVFILLTVSVFLGCNDSAPEPTAEPTATNTPEPTAEPTPTVVPKLDPANLDANSLCGEIKLLSDMDIEDVTVFAQSLDGGEKIEAVIDTYDWYLLDGLADGKYKVQAAASDNDKYYSSPFLVSVESGAIADVNKVDLMFEETIGFTIENKSTDVDGQSIKAELLDNGDNVIFRGDFSEAECFVIINGLNGYYTLNIYSDNNPEQGALKKIEIQNKRYIGGNIWIDVSSSGEIDLQYDRYVLKSARKIDQYPEKDIFGNSPLNSNTASPGYQMILLEFTIDDDFSHLIDEDGGPKANSNDVISKYSKDFVKSIRLIDGNGVEQTYNISQVGGGTTYNAMISSDTVFSVTLDFVFAIEKGAVAEQMYWVDADGVEHAFTLDN